MWRTKFRYVGMSTALAGLIGLSGCGGGGGSGTSTPSPGGSTPPPPAFAVTTDRTSVAPLEMIVVTPNTVERSSSASPAYAVQVDASGLGTFADANTIEVPGLYAGQALKVPAPILEYFQARTSASSLFHLRVRRESDGVISNVVELRYEPIEIPADKRGVPATTLEVLQKVAFEAGPPVLNAQAAAFKPGYLADAAMALSAGPRLADVQAEAVLREVFGTHTSGDSSAAGASSKATSSAPIVPAALRAGVEAITNCIGEKIKAFPFTSSAAADDCMEVARIAYRDQIIPGIADTQSDLAGATTMLGSLLRGGLGRIVGNYAERMVVSAELSQGAVNFGQFALTIPGVTAPPGEAVDFYLGRLTDYGKRKVYDRITEDLHESDRYILDHVGAPEAFSDAVDWTAEQIARVAQAENTLLGVDHVLDRMADLAPAYGGPASAETSPDTIPAGGFGAIEVGAGMSTPADVCNAYPEIGAAVVELGFSSCEAYMAPFFDPTFLSQVLSPMLDRIPWDQLISCASTPETPSCSALFDQVAALLDDIFGAIRSYEDQDFHCSSGYREYEAGGNKRTCIFAQLAYENPACFAGSRPSPFAVGARSVCVYYSRDYIKPDGSCRDNYRKVSFLGQDRCRWETLATSQPAAYSIESDTGDQAVLEP